MIGIKNFTQDPAKRANPYAYVLIKEGRIVRVGIERETADRTDVGWIDAQGLWLLPGVIDAHVHFRTPGEEQKEDWQHGAAAAIAGGVTTVCDMPNNRPVTTSTIEALEDKLEIIGEPLIGHRLWFGAANGDLAHIPAALDYPEVCGVKGFMGSSTGNMLLDKYAAQHRAAQLAAERNKHLSYPKPVAFHCETEAIMQANRRRIESSFAKDRSLRLLDHNLIRSEQAELEAIGTALRIQEETGVPLYLPHVSLPDSVRLAAQARARGRPVFVEVCPHHLFLNYSQLEGPRGGFYKVNPPLRSSERMVELQRCVVDGMVDGICTDHAPHRLEEKQQTEYDDIPSGMPGVQSLLSLSLQFVKRNRIGAQRFVDLTSRNVARFLGLKKGEILVGYDADLILVDPAGEYQIRAADQKSKCGWTPYEGFWVPGIVKLVMSRGKLLKQAL